MIGERRSRSKWTLLAVGAAALNAWVALGCFYGDGFGGGGQSHFDVTEEVEPNDAEGQATALILDITYEGSKFRGTCTAGESDDFFSFNTISNISDALNGGGMASDESEPLGFHLYGPGYDATDLGPGSLDFPSASLTTSGMFYLDVLCLGSNADLAYEGTIYYY